MSRPTSRSIARGAPLAGALVALFVLLTWPLLFTYSGFAGDWEHDLWLVWHQGRSIEVDGLPSYFLSSSYSLFNPIFAFYGGTLFGLTGALSLLLGPVQAYVLVYVLGFTAAFGGWYWLARQAGLGRWPAIVPGLIFVTSSYYVLIAYVQGDWPEFTGLSMIPLMCAAGVSVMRAEHLRAGPAVALVASATLFFGSHNITILLGGTTLALLGAAALVLLPNARRQLTRRSIARVAGLVVPAALLSAWYLLPAVLYAGRTRLGGEYAHSRESIRETTGLVSFEHLFSLSRTSAPGLPPPYYLAMALPVFAIAWVIVGIVVLPWGARNKAWTRLLLICSGLSVLIALAMTHVGLLLALPKPYVMIQFSYRLDVYVVMTLCAAVLAALVLAKRASRPARVWSWLAIPVCAVSLGGVIQQLNGYPYPGADRYEVLRSYGTVDLGENVDYQDESEPLVTGGSTLPKLYFQLAAVHGSSVSQTVNQKPGSLVTTNIAAGAYLLHVTGAHMVGIDAETDHLVLRISAPAPAGAGAKQASTGEAPSPDTVTVSTGDSLPVVLGRALTLCGLALLALQLLLVPGWRLVTRRGRRAG